MDTRSVLLVDDHAPSRKRARSVLEAARYTVYEAADDASALATMHAHNPCIVLLDAELAEGAPLIARLRELAGGRAIAVVGCSRVVSSVDHEQRAALGIEPSLARGSAHFDALLAKPIEADQLVRAVAQQLARIGRGPAEAEPAQLRTDAELMGRCSLLSAELCIANALSEATLTGADLEGELATALASCLDAVSCTFGALHLLDRHDHLQARAFGPPTDLGSGELASFFGREALLREAMSSGETLIMSAADERVAHVLRRARTSRAFVVPLVYEGTPLGTLFLALREQSDDAELGFRRLFAERIAAQLSRGFALAAVTRGRAVADREAEQQKRFMREQAAVWRALVEHAPDTIMELDVEGRIRFINRVPAGATSEGIRDSSWFDLMSVECRADMQVALRSVIEHGVPRTLETTLLVDGRSIWTESHLGPIRSGYKVIGALVIQRDISHKKMTEAQLIIADRMASVGTLAAGVAHEINNPLSSVIANLELAMREVQELAASMPTDLLDELRDAREAAERVRRIVRDLKIFSRSDEDKRGPVDVERVLDSALRMAWNEIRHRARLVKKFEKVPPVEANEARLGQVFLNLIVNAAQAIEEGSAERNEIVVRLYTSERGRIVVSVRDSGSGMAPNLIGRLFTPFVTTKPAGVGTGLGLSICHRILSAIGGTITVESELGKGSEFTVTMLPAPEGVVPERAVRTSLRGALRRGRVLVIDDERLVIDVVRRMLTHDHDVFTIDDARVGLSRLAAGERYDVILCDLMMPHMSGMDFHRELARAYPEQAERIIFFTGGAFTPRAKEFLERVPNHRMEKPIDGQELKALISGLITRSA
jgi:PAS domain S-box-containing protein